MKLLTHSRAAKKERPSAETPTTADETCRACGGRARIRLALGGAICGGFLGSFAGALCGVLYGTWAGDLSLGLDGALIGSLIVGGLGAIYGLVCKTS